MEQTADSIIARQQVSEAGAGSMPTWFSKGVLKVRNLLLRDSKRSGAPSRAIESAEQDPYLVITVSYGEAIEDALEQAEAMRCARQIDLVMLEWGNDGLPHPELMLGQLADAVNQGRVGAVGVFSSRIARSRQRDPLPLVLTQQTFDPDLFCRDVTDYLERFGMIVNLFPREGEEEILFPAELAQIAERNHLSVPQLLMSSRVAGRQVESLGRCLQQPGAVCAGRFLRRISFWEQRQVEKLLAAGSERNIISENSSASHPTPFRWRVRNSREEIELLYFWDVA